MRKLYTVISYAYIVNTVGSNYKFNLKLKSYLRLQKFSKFYYTDQSNGLHHSR